ncbi:hypothetical protein CTAYLR_003002 [Chrysophaeum taylorii]|uniref:Limiting CO2-inducible protein B/C beta carbonyic anhydrase domain-containing protein n=1 Tax=Chrysophaeum taylorii TaxID=2483200 RepID=A0AAD7U548_9STRA|nr:hypothetical protein CTAYLR_003002 [Chrysophaeum taylorii]
MVCLPAAGFVEGAVPGLEVTLETIKRRFGACASAGAAGRAVDEALSALGFDLEKVLVANSTCPDELNRWEWASGFNLGGLGGIPAVGKTGFKACASHASSDENAVIFVFCASHVGVDGNDLGTVLRPKQSKRTTCCGAAIGSLKCDILNDDDAQMNEVKLSIDRARVGDDQALLAEGVYEYSYRKLAHNIRYLSEVAPVVVLGGIQINTNVGLPDFFAPRAFVLIDKGSDAALPFQDKLEVYLDKLNASPIKDDEASQDED